MRCRDIPGVLLDDEENNGKNTHGARATPKGGEHLFGLPRFYRTVARIANHEAMVVNIISSMTTNDVYPLIV